MTRSILLGVCALLGAATSHVNGASLASQPPEIDGIDKSTVLQFGENMIKGLTKNDTFEFPAEFRNEDGSFPTVELLMAGDNEPAIPPELCGAQNRTLTGEGAGGSAAEVAFQLSLTTVPLQKSIGFCMWTRGALSAINLNYDLKKNKAVRDTIPFNRIKGVECRDCWAFVGAEVNYYLDCRFPALSTPTCTIGVSQAGGLGYNLHVHANNPSFDEHETLEILPFPDNPKNIDNSKYMTVFYEPFYGLGIYAYPALKVSLRARGSLIGSADLTSTFQTQAALEFGLTASLRPQLIGPRIKGSLKLDPVRIVSSLRLEEDDSLEFEATITPAVFWKMGIKLAEKPVEFGAHMGFSSIYDGSFTLNQKNIKPENEGDELIADCSNVNSLQVTPNADFLTATAVTNFDIALPTIIPSIPMLPTVEVSGEDMCIAPIGTSADENDETGGSGASGRGSGGEEVETGNTGVVIGIICAVLLVLLIVAVVGYLYKTGAACFKKESNMNEEVYANLQGNYSAPSNA